MHSDKLGKFYTILQDNRQLLKLCGIITSVALFLCGYLQNLIINGSILLYLSYNSFKVLSAYHNHPTETEIIVLLLKKWILFACLMIFEYMASVILKFSFVNLVYNICKLFFLVLLLQNSDHLTTIYDLVGQGFRAYEDKLDYCMTMAEDQAKQFRINHHQEIDQYNVYSYMNLVTSYLPWWRNEENSGLKKKSE